MSDPLFAECVDAEHRDAYNVDVDDAICTLPVRDEAAFICSVEEAVEAGRWRSALPGRDRHAAEANVRSLHYALKALSDDHGGTFIWEFFAGHARPTLLSLHGGHVAGAPVDLLGGYDLRDRHTRQHMLEQVRRHRPRLVTVVWPCRLWGPLARWNHGMRNIPELQEQRDRDEAEFLRFVEELDV